tara:strand:- start:1230 stop:1460 length:231 start_codon:yes stop_codon:yes gene_type:complete
MNIFTFLSIIMTGISKFTVECCDALTSSASAVNKCAQIADTTAGAMLQETEAENEQKIKELKAKYAAKQLPKPLSQ